MTDQPTTDDRDGRTGRRSRRGPSWLSVVLVLALGATVAACGGDGDESVEPLQEAATRQLVDLAGFEREQALCLAGELDAEAVLLLTRMDRPGDDATQAFADAVEACDISLGRFLDLDPDAGTGSLTDPSPTTEP